MCAYKLPPRETPNKNNEMVLQTAQEAQEAVDPTKRGESSGAYSGARPIGLTNAEGSLEVGMDATKLLEKDAEAAETKYITQMATFMNNEKIDPSKKIAELTRFIAWTARKLDNTLIKEDENARKPYEKLRTIAEANLESLTTNRAA